MVNLERQKRLGPGGANDSGEDLSIRCASVGRVAASMARQPQAWGVRRRYRGQIILGDPAHEMQQITESNEW